MKTAKKKKARGNTADGMRRSARRPRDPALPETITVSVSVTYSVRDIIDCGEFPLVRPDKYDLIEWVRDEAAESLAHRIASLQMRYEDEHGQNLLPV